MKHTFYLSMLILLVFGASCSKSSKNKAPLPDKSRVVTTLPATDVTQHEATLNGSVFWKEGKEAPDRVYFLLIEGALVDRGDAQFPSPQQMLAAEAQVIPVPFNFSEAEKVHEFFVDVVDLKSGCLYFYCAAAEFGEEVLYGEVRGFNTLSPEITGLTATDVKATSMTVSFRYEGGDVSSVVLEARESAVGRMYGFSTYTIEDGVYTFVLSDLNPKANYTLTAKIMTTEGKTLSESISVTTQEGLYIARSSPDFTSATVYVRTWFSSGVPTLYYSTDPFVMANDYLSAQKVTMYRIYEAGMPDNYNRDFQVEILNLTRGTKYYILATLGSLKSEISSFTTLN